MPAVAGVLPSPVIEGPQLPFIPRSARLGSRAPKPAPLQPALRATLFTAEQMRAHGRCAGRAHVLA